MRTDTLRKHDACFLNVVHGTLDGRIADIQKVERQNSLSDTVAARGIQAGRNEFIRPLVKEHSDRLYRIILRMVQSPNTAEDILQDTWILVIRKFHLYDTTRPIIPWLVQVAINCCRSHLRRERLRGFLKREDIDTQTKGIEPEPRSSVQKAVEVRQTIDKAMKSLSPRLREAVVLKFFSELTTEEIAEVLKIPAGTVKSRLNYALARMRECIHEGERI